MLREHCGRTVVAADERVLVVDSVTLRNTATMTAAAVAGFVAGMLATIAVALLAGYFAYLICPSSDGGLDEVLFYLGILLAPVGGIVGAVIAIGRVRLRRR